MPAWQKIETIGNVEDELTRLRALLGILYASVTSRDRDSSEIISGLVWVIGDLETDVDRIIAGIQNIQEART